MSCISNLVGHRQKRTPPAGLESQGLAAPREYAQDACDLASVRLAGSLELRFFIAQMFTPALARGVMQLAD